MYENISFHITVSEWRHRLCQKQRVTKDYLTWICFFLIYDLHSANIRLDIYWPILSFMLVVLLLFRFFIPVGILQKSYWIFPEMSWKENQECKQEAWSSQRTFVLRYSSRIWTPARLSLLVILFDSIDFKWRAHAPSPRGCLSFVPHIIPGDID